MENFYFYKSFVLVKMGNHNIQYPRSKMPDCNGFYPILEWMLLHAFVSSNEVKFNAKLRLDMSGMAVANFQFNKVL
jgi:hypothetical protein